ncbi:MAG: hypothetical protein E3K32_02710 [wastewater metagenome]|nr:hypothetical protein [Candidatus Loosdrechtia aerotolerans]
MKSRIFTISFYILMAMVWIHHPLFAQTTTSQLRNTLRTSNNIEQSTVSPRSPIVNSSNPCQCGTNAQSSAILQQGLPVIQGSNIPQTTTGLPGSVQPGYQDPALQQSLYAPQASDAYAQPEPLSPIEISYQNVLSSLLLTTGKKTSIQDITSLLNPSTDTEDEGDLSQDITHSGYTSTGLYPPSGLYTPPPVGQYTSTGLYTPPPAGQYPPTDLYPSLIEKEPPLILYQFGYSLFNRTISTFSPVEDVPVSPDYILGPGDELRITMWGAIENTYAQTVDRYGRIYLPTMGPVRVWGLTFSQAEKLILAHISQYYKGFQSSITMGYLRTIKVYIVGEVKQPGAYNISALSTITNALSAAGGPSKTGSLRKIELKRNNRTVTSFDFYNFLLYGDKSKDSHLESGDVIFVPPIGPVAGIAGEIKRPGIYELRTPTNIKDFIDMAGGRTPQSYLKHVQIIRNKPNGAREIIDLDLTRTGKKENSINDATLKDGDLVRIVPSDPRIYNNYSLHGTVKHPGIYEVKPGMKISQILIPEALPPEACLDKVEVIRFRQDLTTEVIHLNLKKLWEGDHTHDITIQPFDRITVRSEFKAPETVILSGEFMRPGTYTIRQGERLSSVIKRAGGFTDKAYLKGITFTRQTVRLKETEMLNQFMKQYEESLFAEEQAILSYSEADKDLRQLELSERRQQLKIIASRVVLGRVVIHIDSIEKFEGTQDDVILQDGDSLIVPRKPSDVMVLGSVRNPTSFIHREGANVQYYINRGGGFSKSADEKEVYLIKADGSAVVGFMKLRDVEPGDAIIVPPKAQIRNWTWVKDVATIAGQTALTFASLAIIL